VLKRKSKQESKEHQINLVKKRARFIWQHFRAVN